MEFRLLMPDGGAPIVFDGKDGTPVAGVSLTHAEKDSIHTVTLTADATGIRPLALEVSVPLPEVLLTPADTLYYYDDNLQTNDFSDVFSYAEHPTREIAQTAVFKNLENGIAWLCGLVTLHRFYSAIFLRDGHAVFCFELEGKELIPGEPYIMERFMIAGGDAESVHTENALLEMYADRIAEINHAIPVGELPVGWCSWSCYFSDINEEKIRRAADSQIAYAPAGCPNLIQIDDKWQGNGSFCGEWQTDNERFPSGLASLSDYVRDKGMTFGLWLAPCLLSEESAYYEAMKGMALPVVTLGDTTHPFDLGDPRFHEHLRKTFRRLVDEYHVRYFKLDFLVAAIRYFNGKGRFVTFPNGYCVEVLRGALQTIREAVGDEVYLLACGAQTLLGAGIFNGSRMSADIIWYKNENTPPYWTVLKRCMGTIGRRYFYHNKVYIGDPDGVVLRDWDIGDGFNCTYSEAEAWAIATAMSGGAVLSNDELENLSPARRRLYTELLPPLGVAARPVDYFETPYPTAYVLEVDENTQFLALYNFDDKVADLAFDLERIGMKGALCANCRSHEFIGFRDTITVKLANPHSAAMFLLQKPGAEPALVGTDANIFMGINLFSSEYVNGVLTISESRTHPNTPKYVLWPDGYEAQGRVIFRQNGYTLTEYTESFRG